LNFLIARPGAAGDWGDDSNLPVATRANNWLTVFKTNAGVCAGLT
jgi:hypothetical protein